MKELGRIKLEFKGDKVEVEGNLKLTALEGLVYMIAESYGVDGKLNQLTLDKCTP